MSDEKLYFNGINGASGDYETPPMTAHELAQVALGGKKETQGPDHYAPVYGIDKKDLSQTGWGVIFAQGDDKQTEALKEALQPLLDHRRAQAAKTNETFYREFTGPQAYKPGETKNAFLKRHKVGPGPADPKKMPYYLLVVGDPETVPYMFQYQLDVQYAVGRLHFETPEEYHQYAQNVVLAEQKAALARRATFFGVSNPDDRATQLSAEKLIKPLSASVANPNWTINTLTPEECKKARLASLLNNAAETPSLLFTASHGMGFPNGDSRQFKHQGALLCQDWPGPKGHKGRIPEDFYFSADDINSSTNLLGMLAFFFACYGCGTPKLDDYSLQQTGERPEIAPHAFLANLPRKMLTQGALAVVGHVERAWGTSFVWDTAGPQLAAFESTLKELMDGLPIGSATEYFNSRYSEISTMVSELIETGQTYPDQLNEQELAGMWTANNDSRSYVVIGDPAVRLPFVEGGAAPQRPSLEAVVASAPKAASSVSSASFVVAPSVAPAEAPVDVTGDVNYGLSDSVKQVQANVQDLVNKLTETLKQVMDDVMSLEVRTYVSDDLTGVKYDYTAREFNGAKLRAMTRISLDGDTLNCVPDRGGRVDTDLWQIHLSMVQQAQASRAEMLKTAMSLLGSLKAL